MLRLTNLKTRFLVEEGKKHSSSTYVAHVYLHLPIRTIPVSTWSSEFCSENSEKCIFRNVRYVFKVLELLILKITDIVHFINYYYIIFTIYFITAFN